MSSDLPLFGVRRQSEAATALWMRIAVIQSGAALRLPPQSKERSSHEHVS